MNRKSNQEKIDNFFTMVFTKMFDMVGVKYDPEFINQPFWYTKYKWSQEAEREFKVWFIQEYRQQFKRKKVYAEDEARWFLFNYGWGTITPDNPVSGVGPHWNSKTSSSQR